MSILFVLFLIQHILIKQPDIISKVATAEDFSDIEIRLLNGDIEPIGYYEGEKHILLIFWNSSTDACKLAMDRYSTLANNWQLKYDVEIISVNVGEPESTVEETKSQWGIDLKIGLDPDKEIAKKLGVSKIPSIVIIGKDGSICMEGEANDSEIQSEIRDCIDDSDDKKVQINTDINGNITSIKINGEEPDSATMDSIIKAYEGEID